jgi:acyl-CoA synthetase (AMP-forming)/AMP-acid ligase II
VTTQTFAPAALHGRGDALAVVTDGGMRLSYADLACRVAATGERLGVERRLVLLAAENDVDTLVTYLAAQAGGHPVLLADPRHAAGLARRYDPDVVAGRHGGGWLLDERRQGTAHDLHPELALLLSTSGSTGAPKLVRIPATAVTANAAAIAQYLGIRDTDRAVASLPLQYCYGLSIVNSNLHAGAAVLLTGHSVTDPAFWQAFRDAGGTSLHGVPHTFELLDRAGFAELDLPQLRYVTQAGGRLAPDAVRRYAELGARRGWQLFVMYGQTEATARMAYLPPERAATCPTAIGVPVPGGRLEIDAPDATGTGELVYRGPNVMFGYAEEPADRASGRDVDALRTGDLGRRRPDGLFEVVGRRSRTVKPFGLRVDLERVERLLADEGCTAACAGSDDELVVAVTGGADPTAVAALVGTRTGLPPAAVRVVALDTLPRGANGKVDHAALATLTRRRPGPRRWGRRPRTVHDAFRSVFPLADLPEDATFTGLGGDSLSYVQMTVALQRVLGHLPPGWDRTPIGELARRPRRRRVWVGMETGVVLRALAIVLVVGSHAELFDLKGGAHLLLGVTGWAFARFVLTAGTEPSRAALRALVRIAVPTVLWISWRAHREDDIDLVNALLLNRYLDPAAWGYWYVETLVQLLALLAVLFAVPGVRRLERACPLAFACAVLAVGLAARLFPDTGNEFSDRLMSAHLVLWLFALGWVTARAAGAGSRIATAGLVVLLVPGFFENPLRDAVVTGGLLLLVLVPRLPVPRLAVRPIGAVAAASLAIYLTHYAVLDELRPVVPLVLVVVACIVVGMAVHATIAATGSLVGTLYRHPWAGRHRTVTSSAQPAGAAVPSTA